MSKTNSNTDGEKRGKLLFLAGFVALSIFVTKIVQSDNIVEAKSVYLNALIYFFVVFFGLLWAFSFLVKKKSFIFISQVALFVSSQELFIEFFFFQKFSRIYEAFILLLLIFMVFVINYFAFLTANVLNVDLFKKIPLVQIGRTGSYIISILMMYFFTFSFLLSGFNIYVMLPLILVSYVVIILMHYVNIGLSGWELYRKTVLTTLISFILFLGVFLSGNSHEVISIMPVVGYYWSVNLVSQENISAGNLGKNISWYVISLIVIFFFVLFVNIF